jgi:hypothetical protein
MTIPANTLMRAGDSSGDRRLSYAEVTAAVHALFQSPLDHPATVATIERVLSAELRQRIGAKLWADWLFAIADHDKDKRITREELLATYRRHQPGSDPDRDGLMDQRELIEAMQSARAPRDPQAER